MGCWDWVEGRVGIVGDMLGRVRGGREIRGMWVVVGSNGKGDIFSLATPGTLLVYYMQDIWQYARQYARHLQLACKNVKQHIIICKESGFRACGRTGLSTIKGSQCPWM
jgi:hypothetical protein